MEESVKYFVPDISDIRVGYECERRSTGLERDKQWSYCKIDFYDMQNVIIENRPDWYRVPYLTKEQIEAEGWETDPSWDNPIEFWKEDYVIKIYKEIGKNKEKQAIRIWHGVKDGQQLFMGECKDINTFRYICKLLNIG